MTRERSTARMEHFPDAPEEFGDDAPPLRTLASSPESKPDRRRSTAIDDAKEADDKLINMMFAPLDEVAELKVVFRKDEPPVAPSRSMSVMERRPSIKSSVRPRHASVHGDRIVFHGRVPGAIDPNPTLSDVDKKWFAAVVSEHAGPEDDAEEETEQEIFERERARMLRLCEDEEVEFRRRLVTPPKSRPSSAIPGLVAESIARSRPASSAIVRKTESFNKEPEEPPEWLTSAGRSGPEDTPMHSYSIEGRSPEASRDFLGDNGPSSGMQSSGMQSQRPSSAARNETAGVSRPTSRASSVMGTLMTERPDVSRPTSRASSVVGMLTTLNTASGDAFMAVGVMGSRGGGMERAEADEGGGAGLKPEKVHKRVSSAKRTSSRTNSARSSGARTAKGLK
ncbi:hypothetical protein HK101_008980 [Irineochytrium annulatum]|nr:hypothetical protein HK101_008980 [Irineochytrium annulatum]